MLVELVKCDECGALHEPSREGLNKRPYIGIGDYHFCKACARKLSVWDVIQKQANMREKDANEPKQ